MSRVRTRIAAAGRAVLFCTYPSQAFSIYLGVFSTCIMLWCALAGHPCKKLPGIEKIIYENQESKQTAKLGSLVDTY
jgi:hypothetical protein